MLKKKTTCECANKEKFTFLYCNTGQRRLNQITMCAFFNLFNFSNVFILSLNYLFT